MNLLLLPLIAVALLLLLLVALVHLGFRVPPNPERGDPGSSGMEFETVSIPTVAAKRLFGWFLPVPGATGSMVILHGWGSNAELMLPLALPFHRAGLNVLLVDARNHGRSDRHGFSSLPRFAEDLDHAIEWLREQHPGQTRRVALLGHSVGAGAVLLSASRRSDVDAVISVSAFAHPRWMIQRFLGRTHLPGPVVALVIRYVEWLIGHRYDAIAPIHTVCRIRCPVLLVHGEADRTVPVEDAVAIERACRRPHIKLLTVANADHESVERIEIHAGKLVRFLQQAGFPFPGRCPGLR